MASENGHLAEYARRLLGELPDDWRYARVGELEKEGIIDDVQDGNHGERHPKSADFVPSGVPFIMAKDLINGRLNTVDCNFIAREQADGLRIGFARPGDVLLTHKATMGRVAVVPDGFDYIMLTPQVTYYRIGNPKTLDAGFLKYAFLSPRFQHQLNATSDQSTRKFIGITAQRDLWFPLPPLSEQKAIAEILGALDAKIELNRRMNETLESLARSLFKSWFVDFDPVRAKMDGRQPPNLPPATAALFPDSFEHQNGRLLPAGWSMGTLRQLCERVENGGTPKRNVEEYWEPAEVPWLTSGEVRQPFVVGTENYISHAGLENSSAKMWPQHTTVVALYGATAGIATLLG